MTTLSVGMMFQRSLSVTIDELIGGVGYRLFWISVELLRKGQPVRTLSEL
jgi:hypothetical protein